MYDGVLRLQSPKEVTVIGLADNRAVMVVSKQRKGESNSRKKTQTIALPVDRH